MDTIIKPDYYDEFVCTGADCPYTCCQEWDINVDNKTLQKWQKLPVPSECSCQKGKLANHVERNEDWYQIKFNSHNNCPFLDERNLCNVIKQYGDKNIPLTCQTFPRETHEFSNHTEKYLTPGCPVVLDLLWKRDSFRLNADISNPDEIFKIRNTFFDLISDSNYAIGDSLKGIFYIGHELFDKSILIEEIKSDIPALMKEIVNVKGNLTDTIIERNELLLDIFSIYNEKGKYTDFIHDLINYALVLEEEDYLNINESYDKFIQENDFTKFLRLLMEEEIMSALITAETDTISDIMIKLQWLALEYSVIIHSLFLYYHNEQKIDYDTLKDTVTYIYRIMGYTNDDIYEYFTNSFEELIWPWGYFALVVSGGV